MFLKRFMNSIVLIAVMLFVVMFSNTHYFSYMTLVVVSAIVFGGLREYFKLMELKGFKEPVVLGYFAGIMLTVFVFLASRYSLHHKLFPESDVVIIFLLISTLFLIQLWKNNVGSILVNVSITMSGVMYVAWLFSFIFKILYFPGVDGRNFVYYYVLTAKANDIFAYIIGSTIGRHKLMPRISPKKTIEGALGGLAGSLVTGIVASGLLKLYFPVQHIIILGLVIGFFSQIGDLAESMLKRDAGVKDSGSLLPGMGGVLDLIDSLLFSAPIMYFYMRIIL